MKGLGKMIGGFLGFLIAGPGGCLLGIVIGHIFDNYLSPSPHPPGIDPETQAIPPSYPTESPYISNLEQAYQILDVANDATPIKVKQAYRRAMNRYHPDRLAQKGLSTQQLHQATQKVQRIKEAYECIQKTEEFS